MENTQEGIQGEEEQERETDKDIRGEIVKEGEERERERVTMTSGGWAMNSKLKESQKAKRRAQ